MQKEKARVNIELPKGDEGKAKGLASAGLGQKVTMLVKGTVTRASKSEYDGSLSVGLELASCAVQEPEKVSLGSAIDKAQRKVG